MKNNYRAEIENWLKGLIPCPKLNSTTGPYRHDIPTRKGHENEQVWRIKKVWNEGRGLIDFIAKDGDVIIVNKYFVRKPEREWLSQFPNVVYIGLGYPDYYSNSLVDMYRKQKMV